MRFSDLDPRRFSQFQRGETRIPCETCGEWSGIVELHRDRGMDASDHLRRSWQRSKDDGFEVLHVAGFWIWEFPCGFGLKENGRFTPLTCLYSW